MAAPISSIENHPQRNRIIEAIAAGRSMNEISLWTDPPVHRAALNRFKSRAIAEHDERVKTAKLAIANRDTGIRVAEQQPGLSAALAIAADPILCRALKSDTRRDRWITQLETGESPDFRTLASLDRNDLTSQEYQAKLAGRLQGAAPDIHVQVVIPIGQPAAPIPDDALTIDIGQK